LGVNTQEDRPVSRKALLGGGQNIGALDIEPRYSSLPPRGNWKRGLKRYKVSGRRFSVKEKVSKDLIRTGEATF